MLWMFSQLSKNYVYTLKIPVFYDNFPADTYKNSVTPDTLTVKTKASGYQIIGFKMKPPALRIDVDKNNLIKRKFWIPENFKNRIQRQLGVSNTIIQIIPDTVFFKKKNGYKKKLKVAPRVEVNFKQGFKNTAKAELVPAFVWVFGDDKILDTIQLIKTKAYDFKNVENNISEDLKLEIPSGIKTNIDKVHYRLMVDQFLEDTLKLPLQVKNLPSGKKIIIFPDKVLLKFKIFSKDYKKLKESDFKVMADYKKRQKKGDDWVLIPQVEKYPGVIFDYQIIPHKIAFLIKE